MKILSATTKTQGSQINTHIILKCICGKGYADALSILTGPGEVGATSPWKFPHALPPIPYRDIRIHTTSHTHTQSTVDDWHPGWPLKMWWDLCCGLYPHNLSFHSHCESTPSQIRIYPTFSQDWNLPETPSLLRSSPFPCLLPEGFFQKSIPSTNHGI